MMVITDRAPIEPVNEMNLPYFAASNPAMKKVLSPSSDTNIRRNACKNPESGAFSLIAVISSDAAAGCVNIKTQPANVAATVAILFILFSDVVGTSPVKSSSEGVEGLVECFSRELVELRVVNIGLCSLQLPVILVRGIPNDVHTDRHDSPTKQMKDKEIVRPIPVAVTWLGSDKNFYF